MLESQIAYRLHEIYVQLGRIHDSIFDQHSDQSDLPAPHLPFQPRQIDACLDHLTKARELVSNAQTRWAERKSESL